MRGQLGRFANIFVIIMTVRSLEAQQKVASVGAGAGLSKDSTAYTFSFAFNRTDPTDAGAGPVLWAHKSSSGLWFLTPTAAANIGNATDVSPDNVLASAELWWSGAVHKSAVGAWLPQVVLAPSMSADKDFRTKLYYLPARFQWVVYNNPQYPQLAFIPAIRADIGQRTLAGDSSSTFERVVPSIEGSIESSNGWKVSVASKGYWIRNDERVIGNGLHGLITAAIDKRFVDDRATKKHMDELRKGCASLSSGQPCSPAYEPVFNQLGLVASFQTGYEEPKYLRLNVVSLSAAWYAK